MYHATPEPMRLLNRLLDGGPARLHRFGHDHDHDHGGAGDDPRADVLAAVRERARAIHERLAHERDVFAVEFVGSTGGGKTALIERLIERAPDDERIGVVGDVAGQDDAERLRALGVPVEAVNTGRECHLDPTILSDALDAFDLDDLDTLYVENVGNMVCPADFPLGASTRVLVVSTTEGDDVARKHPMLVQGADLAVVNKVDLAGAVGTDLDRLRDDLGEIAPDLPVVETCARDGDGVGELAAHLATERAGHAHDRAAGGGVGGPTGGR